MKNFREALGAECTRRLAPNREVRVATGCTGSGGEVFTLLAVLGAFRTLCPNLRFTYQFHAEKHQSKRRFVQLLHKLLADDLGATAEPCFFDDITKIPLGEQQCCTHLDPGSGKKSPSTQMSDTTFRHLLLLLLLQGPVGRKCREGQKTMLPTDRGRTAVHAGRLGRNLLGAHRYYGYVSAGHRLLRECR